jgi:hypothetical protein
MKNQLNALAAALALGILSGLCLFVCTLLAFNMGVGAKWADLMTDVYPWYSVTTKGAFIGLVWGFVDGFIGGYITVALYNFFVKKLGK